MVKLDETALRKVQGVVSDYLGVSLSEAQVEAIVLSDTFVLGNIVAYGVYDTDVRSQICDKVTHFALGEKTPTYGSPKEVQDTFWGRFASACQAKGLVVVEDT